MASEAKHFSQLPMGSLTTMLPKAYWVAPVTAWSAAIQATTASEAMVRP